MTEPERPSPVWNRLPRPKGLAAWASLAAAAALVLAAAGALVARGAPAEPGLHLTVRAASGRVLLERSWPVADLTALQTRMPEQTDPVRARLTGVWRAGRPGPGEVWIKADGAASVHVDGRTVVDRAEGAASRGLHRPLAIGPGWHEVELEFVPSGPSTFAKVQWAPEGEPLADLDPGALFASPPGERELAARAWAGRLMRAAAVAALAAGLLLLALGVRRRRRDRRWPGWWFRAALPLALVVIAGALRFEALVEAYWHVDAPGWARSLSATLAERPVLGLRWSVETSPYRGDPYGYLLAAREPRRLYDAHVREPLFVLATKALLGLVGGHDVAVNLASAGFSVLAVLATYWLGAQAFSPWVGFWAALLLAVERQVIGLSIQGWRDDAFAALVVASAAALVGLQQRPALPAALRAGALGGLATLTRITSLSFLLPAHAWLLLPPGARRRAGAVALSLVVLAALLGPYLLACQLAFGDPLYAINYHTGFYRARLGLAHEAPMAWHDYIGAKGAPLARLDTMIVGLTAYPFANKWDSFDYVAPWLGPALAWAALAGLLLFLTSATGRLLLVVLVSSLLPYAFTWDVAGGGEWRFTLHAYPFYLVAACLAVARLAATLRPARLRELRDRVARGWRRDAAVAAGAAVLAALVWQGMSGLRYLRGVEELRQGRPLTVETGPRDGFFFGRGWSWPRDAGEHAVRRARGSSSVLRLPLDPGRGYDLTLRLGLASEPEAPLAQPALVLLGDAPLAELPLRFRPERLDTHELAIPAERRSDELLIRWPPRAAPVLWYFRLVPREPEAGADAG